MQPRLFCGHSVCCAHGLSAFESGLDIPVPFLHSLSYVEDPPQEEKRVFRRFQRARARTRPKSDFLSIIHPGAIPDNARLLTKSGKTLYFSINCAASRPWPWRQAESIIA